MGSVEAWLDGLGLGQHASLFAANDIELDVLPHLTDADLAALGLSLGHRRKILAAAAQLGAPAVAAPPPKPAEPAASVERRQVTVLFADLVESTALAASLDPEEMSALLRQFQNACSERIAANEGYVAKLMGDGVLAYFGYPTASENTAEGAVRAGLELVRAVAQLRRPDGRAHAARVGIATGVVVVGELIGSDSAQERTIVGETPNMAARLQALARPGDVLAGELTKNLAGGLFEGEFIGVHDLKGFAQPVPVWRMTREVDVESRFAAARAPGASPALFIGRELERDTLLHAWESARRGSGRAVMLRGEPGMGKSRLVEFIAASAGHAPHRLLRCQCSPYRRTTALFPLAQLLRRLADIRHDRDAPGNLEALRQLLQQRQLESRHALLLLAELLDVPAGDEIAPMEMTKPQRKQRLLALLAELLQAAPDGVPTLLLFEDVHWIDPSTQQLIAMLVANIDHAPLLAVITHRPEYQPPWADLPHATTLTCNRLAADECRNLVRGIAAQMAVRQEVMDEIIRRSDGVPLFVEELTKAVVESQSTQSSAVPPTLRDSLMARLDRLGDVKDVALVASVIGRRFTTALLAALLEPAAAGLQAALEQLCRSGLVFRIDDDDGSSAVYSFSHSLLQEAAYESLLKSRRLALHARVAQLLEGLRGGAAPELLAHHLGRAGQPEPAARQWLRAADNAMARVAYSEALACLERVLEEAGAVAGALQRDTLRAEAFLRQGVIQVIQGGPSSVEGEAAFTRALDAAQPHDLPRAQFQANWGLYLGAATSRRYDVAQHHAEVLERIAREHPSDDFTMESLHHRWGISFFRGDCESVLEHASNGVAAYRPEIHHGLADRFAGHDCGVCARLCVAQAWMQLGRDARIAALLEDGQALAESLAHPTTIQFALGVVAATHAIMEHDDEAAAWAQRHLDFATRYGYAAAVPSAAFFVAAMGAGPRPGAAVVDAMQANLDGALRYGFNAHYPAVPYAQVLIRAGRAGSAAAALGELLGKLRNPQTGIFMSELWRLRAQAVLAADAGQVGEAEQYLGTSLAIAREQRAARFHLRTAIDLAQLQAEHGDRGAACDELQTLLAALPADCDCAERGRAQGLLTQLL